ncbi:hypothetical protein M9H77_30641 [Catharanthus roseus]|uniref:Uncharacterized protein n=1 Tax=Catharanthus roseus TaxID=4058 RepID=A0ACB9ZY61_CATRO|nr:hypothetical protein M9H77_30641 [Catharanthus roseus]
MAPVAPGIGLGISIEEDPSEPTSDSEMNPEPERVAPAATGDMDTFIADTLPSLLRGGVREQDVCTYYLWHEQRVEAAGLQIMELREEISRFLGTTRDSVDRARVKLESRPGCSGSQCPQAENMPGSQSPNHADEAVSESPQNRQSEPIRETTPRLEQTTHKLNDIYDTLKYEDALRVTFAAFRLRGVAKDWWLRASEARTLKNQPWTWNNFQEEFKKEYIPRWVELQRVLAPLPPMGFAAAVKAATRTEIADQAVIQRKTAIGSAATPYKRPGQGP